MRKESDDPTEIVTTGSETERLIQKAPCLQGMKAVAKIDREKGAMR